MPRWNLAVLAVYLWGCGGDSGTPVAPMPRPKNPSIPPGPPPDPPPYVVSPPEGKLPWPQHDPRWDRTRYERMLAEIWVVNNFGLYQGDADPSSAYLHDGIDIGLPNGTPIYAVAGGVVRANIGGNEFYRTLIVEDEDQAGYGWGYTHVNSFLVQPGDRVKQGTRLAVVNFAGLEHIHLDRVKLPPGGRWDEFFPLIHLDPEPYFEYTDTEQPIFQGSFRYVKDQSDEAFLPGADGKVHVSGDVDIVAGLRDPGEWARSSFAFGGDTSYGDRNAPQRIEYEIAGPEGVIESVTSLDFSTFGFSARNRSNYALGIYQHYPFVRPSAPPLGNYNRRFSYFRVTNRVMETPPGTLQAGFLDRAWQTAELDVTGQRLFPDGEYVVTVRAWDSKGNVAERSETVVVAN